MDQSAIAEISPTFVFTLVDPPRSSPVATLVDSLLPATALPETFLGNLLALINLSY